MKGFKASFVALYNKITKFDKRLGIHNNGVDNNYPDFVEYLVANSVTAGACFDLMSDYLVGRGFSGDLNDTIVNEEKGTTLLQFTKDVSDSITMHKGVFIHVNRDGNSKITDMDVLPFGDCRVGRKDSTRYNGKIIVCSDWSDDKSRKKASAVDVFNNNEKVIQAQINKAGSIEKYNGQILYFKETKFTYPLSRIHPCVDDAEAEKTASIYKNTSLKKGFFGKTLVITKPLVDVDLKDSEEKQDIQDYQNQLNERKDFKKTLQQFIGAGNVDGVLHLEMEMEGDEMANEILFKNIESNINDKLFAYTESSVKDNLRMCFKNVPSALILSQDGKMFGSSGEAIKEMKKFYQDQTEFERMKLQELVNTVMSVFVNPVNKLEIIPLIVTDKKKGGSGADSERLKAQATLKGSVGGVTALLQIQQSVANGTTEKDAAIAIIEEIFGIDREKASEMLGNPKESSNEKTE